MYMRPTCTSAHFLLNLLSGKVGSAFLPSQFSQEGSHSTSILQSATAYLNRAALLSMATCLRYSVRICRPLRSSVPSRTQDRPAASSRGVSPASTRPPSRPTSRGPSRDSRAASPAMSRRSTGIMSHCAALLIRPTHAGTKLCHTVGNISSVGKLSLMALLCFQQSLRCCFCIVCTVHMHVASMFDFTHLFTKGDTEHVEVPLAYHYGKLSIIQPASSMLTAYTNINV